MPKSESLTFWIAKRLSTPNCRGTWCICWESHTAWFLMHKIWTYQLSFPKYCSTQNLHYTWTRPPTRPYSSVTPFKDHKTSCGCGRPRTWNLIQDVTKLFQNTFTIMYWIADVTRKLFWRKGVPLAKKCPLFSTSPPQDIIFDRDRQYKNSSLKKRRSNCPQLNS